MALVDFSNAVLHLPTTNPLNNSHAGMLGNFLTDSNGNSIGSMNTQVLKDENKRLVMLYNGTFSTSGTELYFGLNIQRLRWRISNISFQNGDNFTFQIPINLICN